MSFLSPEGHVHVVPSTLHLHVEREPELDGHLRLGLAPIHSWPRLCCRFELFISDVEGNSSSLSSSSASAFEASHFQDLSWSCNSFLPTCLVEEEEKPSESAVTGRLKSVFNTHWWPLIYHPWRSVGVRTRRGANPSVQF